MAKPLIGITVHPDDDPDRSNLDTLVALILRGVEQAGGLPVVIPLGLAEDTLRGLAGRLDGLLLSGGGDVGPERYGDRERHPSLGGVSEARDQTELQLVRWAVRDRQPLFGICRGAQLLNVALGGSLYQDISQHPGAIKHTYGDDALALLAHEVQVAEESTLARVLGQPVVRVNSLHHQGLRALAPGLRVTAVAPDGLAEAVELPDHPYAVAVQWHPECLLDLTEQRALFTALIDAARR